MLERIADQKQQNSINSKSATEIKSEIDKLTKSNAEDNARIDTLKTNFLKELEVKNTLQFIADNSSEINQKYQDYGHFPKFSVSDKTKSLSHYVKIKQSQFN